jgi:hypothetical protein
MSERVAIKVKKSFLRHRSVNEQKKLKAESHAIRQNLLLLDVPLCAQHGNKLVQLNMMGVLFSSLQSS